MPQPTKRDLMVSKPLTSVSLACMQDMRNFIARRVFPTVQVDECSGTYYEYGRKQWLRSDARCRAPGTESVGSGYNVGVAPDPYNAKVRALHKNVDDQIRACADNQFNLDREATAFVTHQLLLGQELDWADKFFKPGVWAKDSTPATLWDAVGSDPIGDIDAAQETIFSQCGMEANKLILSRDVFKKLKNNEAIIDRIKYSERGVVTEQIMASVLGVSEILVASGIHDTTQEMSSEVTEIVTPEYIFSKGALLVHAAPRPGLMTLSAGYTFAWRGYLGANREGLRIKKFRMEELAADRIEGEMAYDHKVISRDAGYFFDGAIS